MNKLSFLLLLLAGCVDAIPGAVLQEAIDNCEYNGGVKEFMQPHDIASLVVWCNNGARFYYAPPNLRNSGRGTQ